MKKKYKKPVFYAEPLVLTSSVASCNDLGEANYADANNCSYSDRYGDVLFYGTTGTCEIITDGYICYNTPNASGNILFANS